MTERNAGTRRWALASTLAAAVLAAGCASNDSSLFGSGASVTASDPTRLTQSGFLSDYKRLAPVSWEEGIQCWRRPDIDMKKFDKVLISRMTVTLKPGQQQGIDPADLKALTDYFHASMVKALKPQMQVVDKAGPGVLVLRIGLTNLVPTGVAESVTGTLIQYAFIAEAGSGVATGKGRMNFSRRYGEHATYFVTKEQIRSNGENAAVYGDANFFGAGGEQE